MNTENTHTMYTVPRKLRLFAIVCMVLGGLALIAGFLTAPASTAEVKEMMAAHGDGHGNAHGEGAPHATEEHKSDTHKDESTESAHHNDHLVAGGENHAAENEAHSSEEEHLEHTLHQMQNRPWSALYIASFFFFMITLGALAFYAIQYAAQAGWSPVLFRVMEGITAYLPVASVIILVLLLLSAFHVNHIFHWMDGDLINPESPKYDGLIAGKSGFLNIPFFLVRALIFLAGWNLYRYFSRKNSIADDTAEDNRYFKRNFKLSAGFLVFFIV
ncbi:MAG: quinol:cytochrome C oxidoreductase, partial [Marinirhabdus sp.]